MKRQSKAEEALNKQIEILQAEIDALTQQIDYRTAQRSALFDFKRNMELQIAQLKANRKP